MNYSVNFYHKSFIGFVSFIGLSFFIINHRISMTRKDALDRFSSISSGKNFLLDSVSFAPKIDYNDSTELASKALSLLNNYIKMDRLRYLRFKEKRE